LRADIKERGKKVFAAPRDTLKRERPTSEGVATVYREVSAGLLREMGETVFDLEH